MSGRQIPHDSDAERAVIGQCLLGTEGRSYPLAQLKPEDFYHPWHQTVFEVIGRLDRAGETVDVVTVCSTLNAEEERKVELLEMLNATPSLTSTGYARTVLARSQSRSLISIASRLTEAGYEQVDAAAAATHFAAILSNDELLRRHDGLLAGFYEDIGMLDDGRERDEAQPWISRGVIRRGQRLLIVARAGLGKSVALRQIAFCAANGVHCWTGQPSEMRRRALIVELEAGRQDITDSTRRLLFAVQRCLGAHSVSDVERPALLHREGGLDLRTPEDLAVLEASIQRTRPEVVVMGPVKYMSIAKPGENYEIAALRLMSELNRLVATYDFALCLEAHFSRGDHGAPGGSERWVDWPDVGIGIHLPGDDEARQLSVGGSGMKMPVKAFRNPRDSDVWLPREFVRGANKRLPWSIDDEHDPYRGHGSIFQTRYGCQSADAYEQSRQGEL